MTALEAVALAKGLLKENPERMSIENYQIHGNRCGDGSRFTWEELMDAIKEHEEAEKSGKLQAQMSQSVRGKRRTPQKK